MKWGGERRKSETPFNKKRKTKEKFKEKMTGEQGKWIEDNRVQSLLRGGTRERELIDARIG